jgi:hypothetical protein
LLLGRSANQPRRAIAGIDPSRQDGVAVATSATPSASMTGDRDYGMKTRRTNARRRRRSPVFSAWLVVQRGPCCKRCRCRQVPVMAASAHAHRYQRPVFAGQLPMAAHGPHRPVCERGRLLAHPSRLTGSRRNRLCKIKRAGRAAVDRHLRADQTPLSVMVHDPRFLIRSFTCCVVIICPGKYSSLPVTSSTI